MGKIKNVPAAPEKIKRGASEKQSTNHKKPMFSLVHLNGGEYCLSKCEKDDKAAFADKLREMSQQTWQQLTNAGRHGAGFEKIEDYPLPQGVKEDVTVVAFRFSGLKAMLGYRDREVFYVIALDRNYTAYKHK